MGETDYGYKILRHDTEPREFDVWRIDNEPNGKGSELITTYAFEHQAREVAEVLNKWATAEI